jgi:5'-nucleotidase
VQIVFQNGGGLRASIDQGAVTMGEVLTVLPFQNTLSTFQISGKDVVAALENGTSQLEEGAGRFAQVAGLKYSFDKSAPVNSRISAVEVMDGGAWKPIDPAKTYLAATNNYVRQGGDGYKIFATDAQNAYDYGPGLEQVVADYLKANRPYTPKLDGRITEIGAAAAQADKPAEAAPAAGATADTATAPKPADAAAANSYVIVAGDNFWNLAKTFYKDPTKWRAIADANPGNRPRTLKIGKTLTIPPSATN